MANPTNKAQDKPAQPRNTSAELDQFKVEVGQTLQELRSMIAGLATLQTASQDTSLLRPVPDDFRERAKSKLRRIEEKIEAAKVELASGPLQFRCYQTGAEQRALTVGATDMDHAVAKYHRYNGIRAIMDPEMQVIAEPMESEAAA
ncbi:MAG: hypothetical protein H8E44_01305 [Planctomycetes bacterium]|nr:hypothetical protein [Planctomycetota bacterium]